MTTAADKKFVLGLPLEVKLDLLESALKKNEFRVFVEIASILDAPISKGGVPLEMIDEVRKKYFDWLNTTQK